jgi:ATP-dependent exoDNAse (exonuclease V) alpha subunit
MEDTNKNIFITGRAGTGKSTLLEHFVANTTKNLAVLAPTGVAALNVKGETIHSFFRFSPSITVEEAEKNGSKSTEDKFLQVETIVIDEVSMVRADLLDCVDVFLRMVRKTYEPFGGVQIIFFGDLYQLPPVVAKEEKEFFQSYYKSAYFFDSFALTESSFEMEFIELETVYRQKDEDFIELLNSVRDKSINKGLLDKLNSKLDTNYEPQNNCIVLTATNKSADEMNKKELKKLADFETLFEAEISGDFKSKDYPTDEDLVLKEGAQVMFLNNDSKKRWVNGTIGKVVDVIEKIGVEVELEAGKKVFVTPYAWELKKYDYDEEKSALVAKTTGSFTQLPLRLAWGITIHKSQGKTFDNVLIDLGWGSFAHGQTYVALSRCTSFDGVVLKTPVKMTDIRLDNRVVQFMTHCMCLQSERLMSLEDKLEFLHNASLSQKELTIVYLRADNRRTREKIIVKNVEQKHYLSESFWGMSVLRVDENEERVFRVERVLEIL